MVRDGQTSEKINKCSLFIKSTDFKPLVVFVLIIISIQERKTVFCVKLMRNNVCCSKAIKILIKTFIDRNISHSNRRPNLAKFLLEFENCCINGSEWIKHSHFMILIDFSTWTIILNGFFFFQHEYFAEDYHICV